MKILLPLGYIDLTRVGPFGPIRGVEFRELEYEFGISNLDKTKVVWNTTANYGHTVTTLPPDHPPQPGH